LADRFGDVATNTGCKSVWPPPISGRTGEMAAMAANRLKKWSSGPNTTDGRRITAEAISSRTAASPAAFERAKREAAA